MSVKQLSSPQEFAQAVASQKLTVVDFFATWCGPCRVVAPVFAQFAGKYPSVSFVKVDVDQLQSVAQEQSVSAMPTFMFFKKSQKVAEMKGANPQQLELLIKQHADIESASAGQGNASYISAGYQDITTCVDMSQLDCLNQKQSRTAKGLFKNTSVLESDCDEQLLLTIPFNQAVKIHSIKFIAEKKENAPKTIKLFANQISMSFERAESDDPTQEIQLTEKDFDESTATPLRFVKFQNVVSLTIFVRDNQADEETTIIKGLRFIGMPVETTRIEDLKQTGQADGLKQAGAALGM